MKNILCTIHEIVICWLDVRVEQLEFTPRPVYRLSRQSDYILGNQVEQVYLRIAKVLVDFISNIRAIHFRPVEDWVIKNINCAWILYDIFHRFSQFINLRSYPGLLSDPKDGFIVIISQYHWNSISTHVFKVTLAVRDCTLQRLVQNSISNDDEYNNANRYDS